MSLQLAQALLAGKGVEHDCGHPRLLETHISWVVLLGPFAYKIKKPLNLGFLDYSNLALRKACCEEELRLNRRTAANLYLQVIAFSGSPTEPQLTVAGATDPADVFEYAVQMARFPQEQILSNLASQQQLDDRVIDALALAIANFHNHLAATVPPGFDCQARILAPARDNFQHLTQLLQDHQQPQLERLRAWTEASYQQASANLAQRYADGYIRECHGDLHLSNILFDGDQCLLFDAIEFNPQLYWIDTASDLAFTVMDMNVQLGAAAANRLLNEYLARSGDYGLLAVFNFYLAYRSMVRAKVHAIQSGQAGNDAAAHQQHCQAYLAQTHRYSKPRPVGLILMCGFSGSGKTTVARRLAAATGFIHLRSDIERKRLHGLAPEASSRQQGLDIYTAQASSLTKARLLQLTRQIIGHGYGVIVDATFITADWRQSFLEIANQHSVTARIIHCQVSAPAAKARLAERQGDASEASYNQFVSQQAAFEAFRTSELALLWPLDTEDPAAVDPLADAVRALFQTRQPAVNEDGI